MKCLHVISERSKVSLTVALCSASALFWPIIQHNNSGAECEIVTIFRMWLDTEWVKLLIIEIISAAS